MAELKYGYTLEMRIEDFSSIFSGRQERKVEYVLGLGEVETYTQNDITYQTLRETVRFEFTSYGSKADDAGFGFGCTVHPLVYPSSFFTAPHALPRDEDNHYRFGAVHSGKAEFNMSSMYSYPVMGFVSKAYEYTLSSKFDLHAKKHEAIHSVWYKIDDLLRVLYSLHCLGARHMREGSVRGHWHLMGKHCQFSGENIRNWITDMNAVIPAHAQRAAEMATA